MTAPLRPGDPVVVKVALGDRAYDIVIGRGLLPSLGRRIAALKPGAKAAIVALAAGPTATIDGDVLTLGAGDETLELAAAS